MFKRCYNQNNRFYQWYGAKGVTVCDRWHKFENFLADMGPRPEGTTLGRFGDVGDYSPSNCAWQTQAEQQHEKEQKRYARALAA